MTTSTDKEVVVPVNVQGVADKGIISYEFDLRFDPLVMQRSAGIQSASLDPDDPESPYRAQGTL